MTIVKEIMKLLENNEMTSVEIAEELGIKIGNCSSYLNTLMNDGRIIRITDKKPYKYKVAIPPKELLKQLYDLMENKMDFIKPAIDDDLELLETIREVIK